MVVLLFFSDDKLHDSSNNKLHVFFKYVTIIEEKIHRNIIGRHLYFEVNIKI